MGSISAPDAGWSQRAGTCHNAPAGAHRDRIDHSKKTERHSALSVHVCISTDAQAPPRSRRRPDHFQVYTGQVRVGTIYKTSGNPTGNQWYWGLNGVQNGPGPFNGFVRTLEDAKAEFAASWGAWLKAAGLNEDTPTAQLKDLGFRIGVTYILSMSLRLPLS